MQGKYTELEGKIFGFWTVVGRSEAKNKDGYRTKWDVICVCGNKHTVSGGSLRAGDTKSCGCKKNINLRSRPYEALYNLFLRAARVSTREVAITYEDFVNFASNPICHYCDSAVIFKEYGAKSCRYNLDRTDNDIGYTVDNCVVCCKDCNGGKGARYTYGEWKAMAAALKLYRLSVNQEVPNVQL